MKIRIEISENGEEEVVIKCKERTESIDTLVETIEGAVRGNSLLVLYIGNTEYYIAKNEILFFETSDSKVYAHTKDHMYMTYYRLFELENIMPPYFVRVSKSVVANIKKIGSLHRELTGNGEISFTDNDKKTYFSRGYYNILKDKIEEVRFGK